MRDINVPGARRGEASGDRDTAAEWQPPASHSRDEGDPAVSRADPAVRVSGGRGRGRAAAVSSNTAGRGWGGARGGPAPAPVTGGGRSRDRDTAADQDEWQPPASRDEGDSAARHADPAVIVPGRGRGRAAAVISNTAGRGGAGRGGVRGGPAPAPVTGGGRGRGRGRAAAAAAQPGPGTGVVGRTAAARHGDTAPAQPRHSDTRPYIGDNTLMRILNDSDDDDDGTIRASEVGQRCDHRASIHAMSDSADSDDSDVGGRGVGDAAPAGPSQHRGTEELREESRDMFELSDSDEELNNGIIDNPESDNDLPTPAPYYITDEEGERVLSSAQPYPSLFDSPRQVASSPASSHHAASPVAVSPVRVPLAAEDSDLELSNILDDSCAPPPLLSPLRDGELRGGAAAESPLSPLSPAGGSAPLSPVAGGGSPLPSAAGPGPSGERSGDLPPTLPEHMRPVPFIRNSGKKPKTADKLVTKDCIFCTTDELRYYCQVQILDVWESASMTSDNKIYHGK